MEHERSLPHSQEPAICSYPEPKPSRPYTIPLLKDSFQYYPLIYDWIFHFSSLRFSPNKTL